MKRNIISSTMLSNSTLKDFENWLVSKKEDSIQLDLETNGLDPHLAKIHSIQFGDRDLNQFLIDFMYVDSNRVFEIMNKVNSTITWIIHNANFEYKILKKKNFILNKIYCTLLAEKVLYQGWGNLKSYSLENVTKNYLGIQLKKDVRKDFLNENFKFSEQSIEYAFEDVTYLHKIADLQIKKLKKQNLIKTAKFEFEAMFPLADIEYNGFLINKDLWLEKDLKRRSKLKILENSLDIKLQIFTDKYNVYYVQGSLFEDTVEQSRLVSINWGSPKQVLNLFNYHLDLYPINKDGKESADEYGLSKLLLSKTISKDKEEFIETLLNYREIEKQISTYGKAFILNYCRDYKDGRGLRAYTSFNQIVSTGRVSSGNKKSGTYNAQNIPQSIEFRECFTTFPSRKIITCDYSGQETRIIADVSNEESMINFIMNENGDMHSWVGEKMFSKKFNKPIKVSKTINPEYRNAAKSLGFLINYGGSDFALAGQLDISKEEAKELIDLYFKAFPKLKKYHDIAKKETMTLGYVLVDKVIGRKAFIPDWDEFSKLKTIDYENKSRLEVKRFYSLKGEIERKAVNYKIQGTAASQIKQSLIDIRKYIIKNELDCLLVSTIHDEIVVDAEESMSEEVAKNISELMRLAGNKFVTKVDMTSTPIIENTWVK